MHEEEVNSAPQDSYDVSNRQSVKTSNQKTGSRRRVIAVGVCRETSGVDICGATKDGATVTCQCGCGTDIPDKDKRNRPRRYIWGHNSKNQFHWWMAKPDSINYRTCRGRAHKLRNPQDCELKSIGHCLGPLEVHHKDGNPVNNENNNLMSLCMSHHKLVEHGRIDLTNPVMPPFYVSSGKRRYAYEQRMP